MTHTPDDFDQDFDEATVQRPPSEKPSMGKNLSAAWQGSPLFKMFVLVVIVVALTVAAIAIFSGSEKEQNNSNVKGAANVQDTPGRPAPPAYVEAVNQASVMRAEKALQGGGSAIPTPVSGNENTAGLGDQGDPSSYDPLAEFRPNVPESAPPPQAGQPVEPIDPIDQDSLGKMQQQLTTLFESWRPTGIKTLQVMDPASLKKATPVSQTNSNASARVIVPAGSVYYGQLMVEANSDAPGPILADILSGPFTGGRAIGQFEVTREYLVIHFTKISYHRRDYAADILALDPNTTLGGLVTEKDNRYFTRVLLPSAAAFLEGFGSALSTPPTRVITGSGDVVVVQQSSQGVKDGLYRGLAESASTVSGFMRDEAAATKPLIRVAVGTPMGLFFVNSVTDDNTHGQPIQTPIAPQPTSPTPTSMLQQVNPMGSLGTGPISGVYGGGSSPSQSSLANGGLNIIQNTPK